VGVCHGEGLTSFPGNKPEGQPAGINKEKILEENRSDERGVGCWQ
jgi:hypothetical protein